jgi:hypothetical protein
MVSNKLLKSHANMTGTKLVACTREDPKAANEIFRIENRWWDTLYVPARDLAPSNATQAELDLERLGWKRPNVQADR